MVLVFHINYKFLKLSLVSIAIFLILHEVLVDLHVKRVKTEQIDLVYTWVNGSDPQFVLNLHNFIRSHGETQQIAISSMSAQRFDDKNELKYSLRSIEKYAPWINHIYIVTNGQIPSWLNMDHEKVSIVQHSEIFDNPHDLPTFSSPAIELQLHRIPGLSQHFIYMNDDVFLASDVYPEDFLARNNKYLVYLAWLVPECAPDCAWLYVGDGNCDASCLNPNCQMDGDDCAEELKEMGPKFEYKALERNLSAEIDKFNRRVMLRNKVLKKRHARISGGGGKGSVLLQIDTYAQSLQHTQRVLNKFYGFANRRVPSHAPILINKEIMQEMQLKFKEEVDSTRKNRLRNANDLQFAFVYYHFLLHETKTEDIDAFFSEFDVDKSNDWSENELRTLILRLYDSPVKSEVMLHFRSLLRNCSGLSADYVVITKEFVNNCKLLMELSEDYRTKSRFNFELVENVEKNFLSFKMLRSNLSEIQADLDEIRVKRKKFVCLNDNLDEDNEANAKVKEILGDFYAALFPRQSKFELEANLSNKYLYVDEMAREMNEKRVHLICLLIFGSVLLFLLRKFVYNGLNRNKYKC